MTERITPVSPTRDGYIFGILADGPVATAPVQVIYETQEAAEEAHASIAAALARAVEVIRVG